MLLYSIIFYTNIKLNVTKARNYLEDSSYPTEGYIKPLKLEISLQYVVYKITQGKATQKRRVNDK